MYYVYKNRGKCIQCNQIIWTTDNDSGVVCQCSSAIISPSDTQNVVTISDGDFINSIKREFPHFENEEIMLIQL